MTDSTLPPIGAYAKLKHKDDPANSLYEAMRRSNVVYRIAAIRGKVSTSAGSLVSPSPIITLEDVRTKERTHMPITKFNQDYYWEHLES